MCVMRALLTLLPAVCGWVLLLLWQWQQWSATEQSLDACSTTKCRTQTRSVRLCAYYRIFAMWRALRACAGCLQKAPIQHIQYVSGTYKQIIKEEVIYWGLVDSRIHRTLAQSGQHRYWTDIFTNQRDLHGLLGIVYGFRYSDRLDSVRHDNAISSSLLHPLLITCARHW